MQVQTEASPIETEDAILSDVNLQLSRAFSTY